MDLASGLVCERVLQHCCRQSPGQGCTLAGGSPLAPGQPGGEGVHAGLPLLAAPGAQLGQAASAGRLVAGDQSQLSIESAWTNQVPVSPVDTLPAPRRARAGHQVRALGLAAAAQPRPLVQRVDVEPGQEVDMVTRVDTRRT